MWFSRFPLCSFALALSVACIMPAGAAGPRAYDEGKLPEDARYGKLKNLDGYFPFTPSDSPAQWKTRAEFVRRQILVSQGVWPMPTRTPINAVVHGKQDMGDYTIEKVYFQSYPGHYVTGSLYRPAGDALKHAQKVSGGSKLAAVLCPHGHWNNGRMLDQGDATAKKQVDNGEEFNLSSGHSPLQARAIHLARLGCVVLFYDMVGYADSVQFLQHRPGVRAHMNKDEPGQWGFFSKQAELRGQSMMGLQTYNSIAALDFITGLPDVDPKRIGCTGASGGGTQSFILAAIDERIATAVPAVMVSTAMQGGCTCENANHLRVNTGNIEFAALAAPRPYAMTAAKDWTVDMMTKGYPELQQHYKMLGVPDNVLCVAYLQFGHNYNYPSRQVAYKWFNQHLKLGHDKPEIERDFKFLKPAELSVWNAEHPKPGTPGGPVAGEDHEKALLKWQAEDREKQLAELEPKDEAGLARFRYVVGGGWDVLIGRQARLKKIEWELKKKNVREGYLEMAGILRDRGMSEEVPAVFLYPKEKWNKQVVIWVDGRDGKSGIYQNNGEPIPEVLALVKKGATVCAIDTLFTGEFLKPDQQPPTKQDVAGYGDGKQPWMQFVGYTFGYNHPLFSKRVHDVLSAIALAHTHDRKPDAVDIVGVNGAGPWVLAAKAQAGDLLRRVAVDTAGFRFAGITAATDLGFVPGSVGYGDLPALMALGAPGELMLAGEKEVPTLVSKAYNAAGKKDALKSWQGEAKDMTTAFSEWLAR